MRRAWMVAVLAACSFSQGSAPHDGTAQGSAADAAEPHHDGAPVIADAAPDAAVDASPGTCVAHSTDTFGGHHYFKTSDGLDWAFAQGQCDHYGGHLVKITSQGEDDFVTQTFTNASAGASGYTWIGLYDPFGVDIYQWTDGSALGSNYNGFHDHQAPHSSYNCVDTNGTWSPYDCLFSSHSGTCECE